METENKPNKKVYREIKLWSLILIIFATAFIFIYSTYAWFRATLRVEIHELNIVAESDNDMVISLNGIDWGSEVTISKQSIINDRNKDYELHHNQWPTYGLYTVSSRGLDNVYSNSFAIYNNTNGNYKKRVTDNEMRVALNKLNDTVTQDAPYYLAFDLFIKNGTPSPYGDNLYIDNETFVLGNDDENNQNVDSMRIGFSFTPSVAKDATIAEIQGLSCAPGCAQAIYEPNATSHTERSIADAKEHNIYLQDGVYYPTYAVKAGGDSVYVFAGVYGSDKQLDQEHFVRQETIIDDQTPITILHNGIIKARVFIWIEAQDIDTIERVNNEDIANMSIIFRKEMIK